MAEDVKGFSEQEKIELKATIGEIENKLGTKMADKVKADIDKAIEPLNAELSELKKYKVDAEKAAAENQKALDTLIAKGQNIKVEGNPNDLGNAMAKAFEAKKDEMANYKEKRTPISFELKTVGNIGANSNISVSGTPGFVPGGALFEPGRKPYEMRHIRDLVRVVPQGVGMDAYVVRDAAGEGAPTTVLVGAAKPQSDRDWVKTIVPITKYAHYYKIPEEYLADIVWMQDEVTGVGIEELLALEDSKFLTAAASSTQHAGLNASFNSTAFSCPTSLVDLFKGTIKSNNYDVLVAAWTQLRNLNSSTTAVLLHPSDYAAMILTKDTTGQYPFGAPNQNIPNLFGAPIVPHTAVTSDKFFLGDFTKVKVGVRAGLSVRFYDQNEDDAIKNLVTVVIEERVTMAADRADRIIYGDFSDARADLQST